MNNDRFITVNDVARRLGRSTEQVRRYLRDGTLKGTKHGLVWDIDRVSLEAFENRTRQKPTFFSLLRPVSETHALEDVIGIGDGPGSNLEQGKDDYRQAAWWRR